MSTIMSMDCPHCQATAQVPGGFCTACGKAIPSAAPGGPRTLAPNELGTSSAARSLRSNELKAQAKKAAGALLAVAVLQAIFGAIAVFALNAVGNGAPVNRMATTITAVIVFGVAAIFFGLYFWARKNPLPAAIVGLVVFITIHLLDALADPMQLVRGIIFKIIIVAVLVKAIQAGMLYRKMEKEQGGAG